MAGRHTLITPNTVDAGTGYTPRYCRTRGSKHLYLKRELADPSYSHLTPWCQVGKLIPETHARADVHNQPPPQDSPFQLCRGCREELAIATSGRIS